MSLPIAALYGDLNRVKQLLDQDQPSDMHRTMLSGYNALEYSLMRASKREISKLLIKMGAADDLYTQCRLLTEAVEEQQQETIDLLVKYAPNFSLTHVTVSGSDAQVNALQYAFSLMRKYRNYTYANERIEFCKYLIKLGCDPLSNINSGIESNSSNSGGEEHDAVGLDGSNQTQQYVTLVKTPVIFTFSLSFFNVKIDI